MWAYTTKGYLVWAKLNTKTNRLCGFRTWGRPSGLMAKEFDAKTVTVAINLRKNPPPLFGPYVGHVGEEWLFVFKGRAFFGQQRGSGLWEYTRLMSCPACEWDIGGKVILGDAVVDGHPWQIDWRLSVPQMAMDALIPDYTLRCELLYRTTR